MMPCRDTAAVEVWLEWFERHKAVRCRAYLCARYGLDAPDADALMNTARLQVFSHWATIQTPLAYFWTILRREVQKYLRHVKREQLRREAYTLQQQAQDRLEACTTRQVMDILDQIQSHQRQLLWWLVHGVDDAQVAARLGTTPHAVRQARYAIYVALRQQYAH